MIWLRALAFNIAFFGVTALLGVGALPVLLAPRETAMRFGRFWARFFWTAVAVRFESSSSTRSDRPSVVMNSVITASMNTMRFLISSLR